ncbi:hypothetical protein FaHV1S18_123 [Falconid herpesvirus 1]|uniref:Uncharacterized protein n=1 Tax=Falconid herpesvirus 1 TaxID=1510155 RepID=A0A068EPP7_9ALPH|nr:hypothetical protein FaHV1S18_093 [Falconid herpesvirus 1]YP_009046607.1 hypothetical protein FaHV1S18_123 [Falconid herpesvirus 1]AID52783.1 hypothetical protein FaHV1S18_093 [Falconid herpesvirus 1]AID52813.1 hypothetical protein FaHV1S18_123 [Falconid herpesvirus 1]
MRRGAGRWRYMAVHLLIVCTVSHLAPIDDVPVVLRPIAPVQTPIMIFTEGRTGKSGAKFLRRPTDISPRPPSRRAIVFSSAGARLSSRLWDRGGGMTAGAFHRTDHPASFRPRREERSFAGSPSGSLPPAKPNGDDPSTWQVHQVQHALGQPIPVAIDQWLMRVSPKARPERPRGEL